MVSPTEVISEIERFSEFVGSPTQTKTVLSWNPGTYTYVFAPTRSSLYFLSHRIEGSSHLRRLGFWLLRVGTIYPSMLRFCPRISTHTVTVPDGYEFDIVIAGYRLKLINFTKESVLTLPIGSTNSSWSNLLRTEIDVRHRLPPSIPSPTMIETNRQYPYFIDEYVDGEELTNPVSGWKHSLSALRSLRPLYLQQPSTLIPIETVLSDIKDAIRVQGLSGYSVVSAGIELMENQDLPSHLRWCRIHGDFHAGNLLINDDEIYILDWENTTIGYPTTDFFTLFLMQYVRNGDTHYILQMLREDEIGGEIGSEYATEMGPTVYGSKKWYGGVVLLALFQSLLKKRNPTDTDSYSLLTKIDRQLEENR